MKTPIFVTRNGKPDNRANIRLRMKYVFFVFCEWFDGLEKRYG